MSRPLQNLILSPISETLPSHTAKCLEASLTQEGAEGEGGHLLTPHHTMDCHGDHNRGLTGSLGSLNNEQRVWTGPGLLSGSTLFKIESLQRTIRMTKVWGRQAPNTVSMTAPRKVVTVLFYHILLAVKVFGPFSLNIHKPICKVLLSIHTLVTVMG